jgi:hypothetical protein
MPVSRTGLIEVGVLRHLDALIEVHDVLLGEVVALDGLQHVRHLLRASFGLLLDVLEQRQAVAALVHREHLGPVEVDRPQDRSHLIVVADADQANPAEELQLRRGVLGLGGVVFHPHQNLGRVGGVTNVHADPERRLRVVLVRTEVQLVARREVHLADDRRAVLLQELALDRLVEILGGVVVALVVGVDALHEAVQHEQRVRRVAVQAEHVAPVVGSSREPYFLIFSWRSSSVQFGRCMAVMRWTASRCRASPACELVELVRTPRVTPWARHTAPSKPRLRVSVSSVQPAFG